MTRRSKKVPSSVEWSVNLNRMTASGRSTSLTLHLDKEDRLIGNSALNWAKSVAKDWGGICWQVKIKAKSLPGPCWQFGCEGHGGFILVAKRCDVHPCLRDFAEGDVCGNSTFVFEEDCSWEALVSVYPEVAIKLKSSLLKENVQNKFKTCSQDFVLKCQAILDDQAMTLEACYDMYCRCYDAVSCWEHSAITRDSILNNPKLSLLDFSS